MKVNAKTEDNGGWKSDDIKQGMQKQKVSIMVTKSLGIKPLKAKTEYEHNVDWKKSWYKTNNCKKNTYNYCKPNSHTQISLNFDLIFQLLNHYHQVHEYDKEAIF